MPDMLFVTDDDTIQAVVHEASCLLLSLHTSNPLNRIIMVARPQRFTVGTLGGGGGTAGEPPPPKGVAAR